MTDPQLFATDRVSAAVQSCLNAVIDAAAEVGVVLPSRQLASAGSIPYDCEQVIAFITRLTTGAPEAAAARAGAGTYPSPEANMTLFQAMVTLGIVRKTNDGLSGARNNIAPSAADYLLNLTNASGDAATLLSAAEALQEGNLTSAVPRAITFATPSGGLIAVTAQVSLTV